MKKDKKRESAKTEWWYDSPFEFLGWIDGNGQFHPVNDGNRYIYSADAYDWRRVWGISNKS